MKIINSLTKSKELISKKEINIYACGPTVYDYIHIGNARAILFADFLVRYLEFKGAKVNFLQNFTDIDDKIINRAIKENTSEKEIADKYIKAYFHDTKQLNLRTPNAIIRISEHIEDIMLFIKKLVDKNYAYISNGNVYFALNKWQQQYGKLANKKIDELISGQRVEVDFNKQNSLDFSLWKKTDKGITFNSPWGLGRPSWHTECAVLIDLYFKSKTIDIHLGGMDLKFPHHENERIQFLAKNNLEIANIWAHNGHLLMDEIKMSKSLGNIISLKDFVEKYGVNTLKFIFYNTSYSQPLNITLETINYANKYIAKINNLLKKVNLYYAENEIVFNKQKSYGQHVKQVIEYLDNNLNSANTITVLTTILKEINQGIANNNLSTDLVDDLFVIIFDILNFNFSLPTIDKKILQDIHFWKKCLEEKNYAKADQVRKQLEEKGIL
ncbi:cysteine--tRNA ligase [Spiroplasma endosymbiont of Anurida maritima]|uniref:cysteine--tRNA ligase n=1 Tax=Spiroplasma endosymbiont of Anurida maritima TaxID=2967972 RepID=UPI0036D35D61